MKTKALFLISFLAAAAAIHAEEPGRGLYQVSLATMAAGQALDAASSWGRIEANPVLGSGRHFGAQMTLVKAGGAAAILALQFLPGMRKHRKAWTVINFAIGGGSAGVAMINRSR